MFRQAKFASRATLRCCYNITYPCGHVTMQNTTAQQADEILL
jgi:hypothetical protein